MGNSKSAKQRICVLLPSVQHVFGCLAGLARVLSMLPGTLKKKMTSMPEDVENREKVAKGGSLFHAMLVLVVMSVVMLAFEVVVHVKGWERLRLSSLNVLNPSHDYGAHGILPMFYLAWVKFRADYIAPSIRAISNVFIVLFLIQTVDRMILFVGWVWIKLCKIKPTLKTNLVESSSGVRSSCKYPKVLVQIPMCNEKEVYEQSISAACQLDWPKDSIVVQVLDDSDDETVQALIQHHVSYWSNYGVNIIYRHRPVRTGYKAGNLKSGMNCEYVKDCEFVVIFDADFLPKPTFLKMTIPYFKNNPDLGLVQARWTLLNKDVNLLTRLQNINMSSHFEYEQQVNGIFLNFFGFNGTAGVWRIKALKDSGGWLERTTVEDMDIAVRAHLRGWKFIFVNDVKVSCEVPESYNAYRKQQHRWHSGPVRLFFLCFRDVLSSEISSGKKANIIFLFFLLRKLILPLYSFTLSCIVLPMTMFVPEAELPMWLLYYVPVLISFLNSLPARKSFPLVVPYLLFENTMSVAKFDAVVSGILGSSYEWVVTEKTGRLSCQSKMVKQPVLGDGAIKSDGRSLLVKERSLNIDHRQKGMGAAGSLGDKRSNRIYMEELGIGVYLLVASLRSLLSANLIHFFFLFFQGFTFLLVGLDLLSEIH